MKRIVFVLIASLLVPVSGLGASLKPPPSSARSRIRAAPSCRRRKSRSPTRKPASRSERMSDANGNYEFFTVRIGSYVVTAEKDGFSVALVDNVQITVGARQRVDLSMAVGQLSEKIEVSASAVLLQTDSSDRSQVITAEQTKALPLNGREYSALALLSPGVRLSALNTGGFTPREGSFNVNGLRSTFNNFLIDGVDNNAYGTSNQGFSNQVMQPAPDAVGEFKVVTNNMSAEYGRSAGATINVAYASGTNTYRGSAWEFMRRTEMNATGFFRPATGVKPGFDRDQFGGVLGGPIVKSKAFFFADVEIFDQTRSQTASSTIATMAQRAGVLSVDVRNPLTGEVYPAGSTDSDDRVRAQGAERSAGADQYRHRQQPADPPGVHQPDAEGRRQGGHPVQPAPLGLWPRRLARCRHLRQPADLRSVRRRRQRGNLRHEQAVLERRDLHAGRDVAARGALRLVNDEGGQESGGAGRRPAARRGGVWHHRPAHRSARRRRPADAADHRLLGPRAPGDQPAVAVPDGVQSEDQLHLAAGPSLAQDRLRVPARPHRSAGRESAVWPRLVRRPVLASRDGDGREQPLQPRRLHVRRALDLRAEQHPGRRAAAEHALPLSAGRLARQRSADDQRRPALRVRDAVDRSQQRAVELRSRHEVDGDGEGWLAPGSVDPEAGSQQLRPAARPRLHADRTHGDPRRLRHELRAFPPRRRRERAADQRPAGDQRRRRADAERRDLPHHAAGLSRRA